MDAIFTNDKLFSSQPGENLFPTIQPSSTPSAPQQVPPPAPVIPPRNYMQQTMAQSGHLYAPNYGQYNLPMYSGGGYGMFPGQYGQYGHQTTESRFIQMAENNARPAFESIESIVRAVQSVSFMLESMFGAFHSSFRAVLSVADNVARLKLMCRNVIASLFAMRFFNKIVRIMLSLMDMLGIISGPINFTTKEDNSLAPIYTNQTSSWPLLAFFGLMIGAPYVMSRLMLAEKGGKAWNPEVDPSVTLKTAFDFTATTPQELTIKKGQLLKCNPAELNTTESFWICVHDDAKQSGFVPKSYVRQCS